jgi:hypothetical protein
MPNYAVQRRRGTTAEHSSFTGLAGELTVDTTKDTVIVHDGSTAGGIPLLREDVNNLAADAISGDKVHGGTISGSVALADGATAATQSAGNSTTLIATTAFVTTAVAGEDTLAEMGDVALVSAASGDMLVHNGTNWVDVAMSGDATMAANGAVTIAANSVALGTDTTGNYMTDASGGTGVTVTHTPGEGSTAAIAIGQAVATTSNVTFNNLIVDGTLTVNGSTTTVDTTNILIEDPLMFLSSGATGSASVDAGLIVERGDDDNVGFIWDETADQWAAINTAETGGTAGNVTIDSYANMRCDTLTGTATAAQYSDLAERYEADQIYTPGTVVCFGGDAEVTQSTDLYDSKVCGVISANPAHLMNAQAGTNETHPAVALTGRVPCKVMGTIRKGDLMVTSAMPGVAMSADERVPGTIIGKAIQDYTDGGIGVIEILVTLM